MLRNLLRRRSCLGYRIIPVDDDGAADEASRESFVAPSRLRVGDRISRASQVTLLPEEWEVIEAHREVDTQGLRVVQLGTRPARLRWEGTLVVRRAVTPKPTPLRRHS